MVSRKAKGILGSLPILAAAFGRDRGITVGIGGEAAYAKPGHIQLPQLPLDCDEVLEVKAFGYLYYADGHQQFSTLGIERTATSPFVGELFKAIEAVRTELARAQLYPGGAMTIAKLIKMLVDEGGFGTPESIAEEQPGNVLTHGILTHLRTSYLGQDLGSLPGLYRQRMQEIVGDAGMLKLDVLMEQVHQLDTTEDSLRMAERLGKLIDDVANEPPPERAPEQSSEPSNDSSDDSQDGGDQRSGQSDDKDDAGDNGPSDNQSDDSQDAVGSDQSDEGDQRADEGKGQSSGKSQGGKADGQSTDQTQGRSDNSSGAASAGSTSDDQGDNDNGRTGSGHGNGPDQEALRQALAAAAHDLRNADVGAAMEASLSSAAEEVVKEAASAELPKMPETYRPEKQVGGEEAKEVAQFSQAIRTKLRGLMDSRERQRIEHRKQGHRIDSNVIHRVATGSTRVFIRKDYKRKVNTAIQILLDDSTSTQKVIGQRSVYVPVPGKKTVQEKKVDVKLIEVARQATLAATMGIESIYGCKVAAAAFPGMEVLKDFHEPTRAAAGRFEINPRGSTPMAEAMLWSAVGLARRNEERKMLIVITDGDPDDAEQVRELVSRYEASGIEVVGVGISFDAVKNLFPSWTVIKHVSELKEALFTVIKNQMRRVA